MRWIILVGIFVALGEAIISSKLYDSSTCGKSLKPLTRFINGGEKAVSEEFPWSSRISSLKGECSGTLISKKHVLSAAHCFPSLEKGKTSLLSSYRVFLEGMCANGCADRQTYTRGVKNVSLHEKFWIHGISVNDLALIELDSTVPDHVNHACLPTDDFKIDGMNDNIIVTGVGSQYNGNSGNLMKVVLPTLRVNSTGRRLLRDRGGEFVVAGLNGKATCAGDSGGGAMYIINDRYVLVGVLTMATCREGSTLSLNYFTNVVQWLPQIQNGMQNEKLYDRETCGTASQVVSRFIRGGSPVQAMEAPWSVRAGIRAGCSGTLVSRKHVLISAHCWREPDSQSDLSESWVELVGMCGTNECENMLVRNISKVFLHREYFTTGNWSNDISLLELSSPVPAYVHHVCLPTSDFPIDEENDDIILTSVGMRYPDDNKQILQKVVLGKRKLGEKKIQTLYNQPGAFGVDSTDGKAACGGDSGGGAVSVINNRHVLVGIASRSSCYIDEIQNNTSSYFVDVPTWLSRIQKAMGVQLN